MAAVHKLGRTLVLLKEHNSEQIRNFLKEKISEYEGFCETSLKHNPIRLVMFITLKCDLRCSWCGLWETGEKEKTRNSQVMEFDFFKLVLDRFRESLWVELTGGEPFLHSSLFDMIDYASKRKMKVAIPTNGTHLQDSMEAIVRSRISVLNISLNVLQEAERKKGDRTLVEHSNEILENIPKLIEKRDHHNSNLRVTLSYICTKDNYRNIPGIAKLADELKVDGLNFFNLMPFTLPENKCLYEDDGEVLETIERVPQPKTSIKIIMPRLYRRSDLHTTCQIPFTFLAVDPEGNATPCPVRMFIEKLGNVKDTVDLWNSPLFQMRREMFINDDKLLLDFCKTCPCLVSQYRAHTPWTSLIAKGLKVSRAFKIL
jgi:radical SAM protein with 4Fe4S-binding SPASM domain